MCKMRRIVSWDILENLRFCSCFCKTILRVTTSYAELEKAQKRQWLSLPWRDYDSSRSVLRHNFFNLSLKQFDLAHFETWLKQATNLLQKWTLLPEVIYFMLAFIIFSIFCFRLRSFNFLAKYTHASSVLIHAEDVALSNQKMSDRWPCGLAEEKVGFWLITELSGNATTHYCIVLRSLQVVQKAKS